MKQGDLLDEGALSGYRLKVSVHSPEHDESPIYRIFVDEFSALIVEEDETNRYYFWGLADNWYQAVTRIALKDK